MRILIVTDMFPPHSDGSGWSTYYTAKALREKKHEILVVKASNTNKVEYYDKFKVFNVSSKLGRQFVHIEMNKLIKKLIKDFNPDIIHAMHYISVRACKGIKNIPKIATIRDYWPLCFNGTAYHPSENKTKIKWNYFDTLKTLITDYPLIIKILALPISIYMRLRTLDSKKTLKGFDRIICISNFVKKSLEDHIENEKLLTLHNPVEIEKYYHNSKIKSVLFVGKLNKNKGALLMPEAMKKIDLKLIYIGEGELKEILKSKCGELGVDCEFKGYIPNKNIKQIMKESITVVPSLWAEPLGRVHMEAMSIGGVVIANPTGGIPDIVKDGETGLFFDGSSDDLNKKIKMVLTDSKLRENLRHKGYQFVKKELNPEYIISQLENIYNNLIKKYKRP